MSPSCHTLSNAFERSTKIPLTSFGGLQSKDYKFQKDRIRRILNQNQKDKESEGYWQESEGLNPDWLGQSQLFSSRYSKIELKIILSKIFPRIGNRETGL